MLGFLVAQCKCCNAGDKPEWQVQSPESENPWRGLSAHSVFCRSLMNEGLVSYALWSLQRESVTEGPRGPCARILTADLFEIPARAEYGEHES